MVSFFDKATWRALLWAVVAAAAVLVVLWPAGGRELALDDRAHLGVFPRANREANWIEVLGARHWQSQTTDNLWRPLPKAVWTVIGGRGVATPVFATGASVLLAALGAFFLAGAFGRSAPRWRWAGVGALVPLAHPLSADVLIPFVGQADLMALGGVALGLWAVLGRWRGVPWWVLGSLLVAFHAKESAFPAAVALPVVALLSGPGGPRVRRRRAAWVLGAAGMALVVRFAGQWIAVGTLPGTWSGTGGTVMGTERAVGFQETVGRYAWGLASLQVPQTDYSFLKQPESQAGYFPIFGVVTLTGWGVAMAWCAWPRRVTRANAVSLRRRRQGAAALLWVPLFLGPYLNLIPIGAIWAGRFALLPLAGIAWLLVLSFEETRERIGRDAFRGVLLVLGTLLLVGFGMQHDRAREWISPMALWSAEVERVPAHAFAWKNLAAWQQQAGEPELALESVREATRLWPTFGEAWLARGQIERAAGRSADARASFARARGLSPRVAETWAESARLEAAEGRFGLARGYAARAVELAPESKDYRYLLERIEGDLENW